jgi:hypothetical protein
MIIVMKINSLKFILFFFVVAIMFSSCEVFDEHKPPKVEFKTGAGYTSADATVAQGTTIKVGIIGKKVEDDMKTYNISYAYDGATSTTTKETFSLSGNEQQNYDKDYEFTTRNQAGTEKWYFTITDRDGNIAKLSFTLTVN